jgi:hypothetical protein
VLLERVRQDAEQDKIRPSPTSASVIKRSVMIHKDGCWSTKLMRYMKGVPPQRSKNVKKIWLSGRKKGLPSMGGAVCVSGSALVGLGGVLATPLDVTSPLGAFVITLGGPRYVTLEPAG